ncbi:MAG: TrbI/VirB10 family protein [Endomicrobium sp.]|jgi:type IV secretory pathway VirB10-like protein|nr:TrbI/VirB10 family protein [Endomicrobium sp.]
MKKFFAVLISIVLTSSFSFADVEVDKYPTKPAPVKGNYFLHTGFVFDAVLDTAIFSFNSIVPAVASVEYDVRFLDKVMIPKGTKLIAICNASKGINRVILTFQTMVFPNGQEIPFSGIALHTDGSGGIPGKVTKNDKKKLPVKTLLDVGAGTLAATGGVLASGLASGMKGITQQEMDEVYDYYIEIQKGTQIQIFVDRRIEY